MAKRAEGCRLLHLAKRNSSGGLISYSKPIAVIGLEDISLTNNYAEGSAFSDNVQDTNIKKPSYIDISITLRELSNELDLKYRKKLEFALKSGQLLKNNSNDKSSVLDNLHKIITEERGVKSSPIKRIIFLKSNERYPDIYFPELFSSILYTPGFFHFPVITIAAPIIAGTPVV